MRFHIPKKFGYYISKTKLNQIVKNNLFYFILINPSLLKSLLYEEANTGIRNQDVFRVITNIGHNSVGRYLLINYFNENYIDFLAK